MTDALITLLEVFGIFTVAALLVGAYRLWIRLVEGYDPDWHREGNRPRW